MSAKQGFKTVFILGAGASCHLGYPTGNELLATIMRGGGPGPFRDKEFIRKLSLAQSPSIDNFLKSHESNDWYLRLGKAMILYYILERENLASVATVQKGDWYTFFVNAVESMIRDGSGSFDQFDFITFNYDRSLEYTIASRLLHRGHAEHMTDALRKVGAPRFIHIYGRLPETPDEYFARTNAPYLPNQHFAPEYANPAHLGSDNEYRAENCLRYAPSLIKTFFESTEETQKSKRLLVEARHIIFLGFGFHPQNMTALGFDFASETACAGKTIVGTSLGMPATQKARIETEYKGNIELFPVSCLELLTEHFVLGAEQPVVGGRSR